MTTYPPVLWAKSINPNFFGVLEQATQVLASGKASILAGGINLPHSSQLRPTFFIHPPDEGFKHALERANNNQIYNADNHFPSRNFMNFTRSLHVGIYVVHP
jgi:hypothetical protein